MDKFTPRLLDMGLVCTIGKGERSAEVVDSMIKNGAVYLAAMGGAGALCGQCVKESSVLCFEELGCESVKKFTVKDLPLIVACDCEGNSLYRT
jgi:fumarate hydratase subunit beta